MNKMNGNASPHSRNLRHRKSHATVLQPSSEINTTETKGTLNQWNDNYSKHFPNTFSRSSDDIPTCVRNEFYQILNTLRFERPVYAERIQAVVAIVTIEDVEGWTLTIPQKFRFVADLLHMSLGVDLENGILMFWVLSSILGHSDFKKIWNSVLLPYQMKVLAQLYYAFLKVVSKSWEEGQYWEKEDELIAIRQSMGIYLPRKPCLQLDDILNSKTGLQWKKSNNSLRLIKSFTGFYPEDFEPVIVLNQHETSEDSDFPHASKFLIIESDEKINTINNNTIFQSAYDNNPEGRDDNVLIRPIWADHSVPLSDFIDNLLSATLHEWSIVEKSGKLVFQFLHCMPNFDN